MKKAIKCLFITVLATVVLSGCCKKAHHDTTDKMRHEYGSK